MLCLGILVSASLYAQTTPPDASHEQKSELKQFFSFSPPLSLAQDTLPMSTGRKFELFARNTVNPFQFVATAAWAGIAQALDRYPTWGQGGEGYAKRYGAEYASMATFNFFGTFVFPAVLKQDPRYFRKETGGFGPPVGLCPFPNCRDPDRQRGNRAERFRLDGSDDGWSLVECVVPAVVAGSGADLPECGDQPGDRRRIQSRTGILARRKPQVVPP